MSRNASNLVAIDGGPSPETERVLGIMKAALRRDDIRAAAFVFVRGDGSIMSGFTGSRDGHHYAIGHGLASLSHRFYASD